MIDANELKRLHESATPGPWTVSIEECEEYGCERGELSIVEIERMFHSCEWAEANDWGRDVANVDLITYLRNHVPDILEALEDRERLTFMIRSANKTGGWFQEHVWDSAAGLSPVDWDEAENIQYRNEARCTSQMCWLRSRRSEENGEKTALCVRIVHTEVA